jgi:hypothetical protein
MHMSNNYNVDDDDNNNAVNHHRSHNYQSAQSSKQQRPVLHMAHHHQRQQHRSIRWCDELRLLGLSDIPTKLHRRHHPSSPIASGMCIHDSMQPHSVTQLHV